MKTAPEVLLVDDNSADIDLTSEVLARSKQHFHVSAVSDGAEAIAYLRRQGKYAEAPARLSLARPYTGLVSVLPAFDER